MNRRDIELLSAYLDGELKPSDSTKLEARLKTDPELVSVLSDLRATRTLLRKLPARKAPRNFTLTRKMVGQNPPLPRTYPLFRLATVLATLLFFFSIGINSFGAQMASQDIAFGIGGGSGGGGNDTELYAEEGPAMEEPAAAEPAEPAAPAPAEPEAYADETSTEEPSAALSVPQLTESAPTDDAFRVIETPVEKSGETGIAADNEAQGVSSIIPPSWLIGFAIVAILSLLLMAVMRQLSASRWK